MSEIRWTDKVYLDSQGNIRSFDGCPTDQMTQDHFDNLDAYFPSAFIKEVEEAPSVKPCDNCDLYFKAKTKEEMRKLTEGDGKNG